MRYGLPRLRNINPLRPEHLRLVVEHSREREILLSLQLVVLLLKLRERLRLRVSGGGGAECGGAGQVECLLRLQCLRCVAAHPEVFLRVRRLVVLLQVVELAVDAGHKSVVVERIAGHEVCVCDAELLQLRARVLHFPRVNNGVLLQQRRLPPVERREPRQQRILARKIRLLRGLRVRSHPSPRETGRDLVLVPRLRVGGGFQPLKRIFQHGRSASHVEIDLFRRASGVVGDVVPRIELVQRRSGVVHDGLRVALHVLVARHAAGGPLLALDRLDTRGGSGLLRAAVLRVGVAFAGL